MLPRRDDFTGGGAPRAFLQGPAPTQKPTPMQETLARANGQPYDFFEILFHDPYLPRPAARME